MQASGRLGWDVIRQASATRGKRAILLCFGELPERYTAANGEDVTVVASKGAAVRRCLAMRNSPSVLLAWHIGMLKLLPFVKARGTRIALFVHGIEAWDPQPWLTRRMLDRVHLFLTNSDHTWSRFCQVNLAYHNKRHQTVYLGIGSPLGKPVPHPAPVPAALVIGRLEAGEGYKGHRELIQAWPLVLKRVPGARLWIVGDGPLREEYERLSASLGLQASVTFWGRVSDEKKGQLITESRCLAMPSRGEGFGLVYLEAMRYGRPCLVSTVDAGREVVNPPEAGLGVDPDSQDDVAPALARLLVDGEEWRAWSRQARQRYERQFTAEAFQSRLLAALFPDTVKSP